MQYSPKLTLKTAPQAEPVTVAELAAWGGGLSVSDPLLTAMGKAAREMVESYLGAGLITQTWQQFFDLNTLQESWWDGVREGPTSDIVVVPRMFNLNKWPIASVTSLGFYDENDVATLALVATYYLDANARPPRVALRFGYVWPVVTYRVRDAMIAEFIVGYGASGSAVPEAIKSAIKTLAMFMYSHRGDCDAGEAMEKSGAAGFLKPFKVMKS